MATALSSLLPLSLLVAFFTQTSTMPVRAQADAEDHGWPSSTLSSSVYPTYPFGAEEDGEGIEVPGADHVAAATKDSRRSMFWHRMRYYISYAALSADRIPCPPRSGRSYYTPNCYRARGPAHPYSRGCSAITRCRR